jgi:hypothetical protein
MEISIASSGESGTGGWILGERRSGIHMIGPRESCYTNDLGFAFWQDECVIMTRELETLLERASKHGDYYQL